MTADFERVFIVCALARFAKIQNVYFCSIIELTSSYEIQVNFFIIDDCNIPLFENIMTAVRKHSLFPPRNIFLQVDADT